MDKIKKKYRFSLVQNNINGSAGGTAFIVFILVLFGSFMILPFVYSILQSLKPPEELFRFPPRFFVVNPSLKSFTQLFTIANTSWVPFSRYLINSIFITVVGTFGQVIFASMAAFPLSKFKFPGSKFIFNIVVWSLLFTGGVTAIPTYIVMAKLHLINTHWSLILPTVGSSMGLFLMKQFMEQIPMSLIESARIDGAGQMTIWFKIAMPNVRPAWLTLVIFAFQGLWNNTGGGYIYKEQLKTLPAALSQITSSGMSRVGAAAAASVLLMIPPIITFLITQSNVIKTMAHSGIKD